MANYNSTNLVVKFASNVMTANSLVVGNATREVKIEDVTPFGATDMAYASTALKSGKPITVEGLYDDTASTGFDAVFNTLGTSGTLELDFGGTKKFTVTAFVQAYDRIFKVGAMTRAKVTLQPSGAFTET